MKLEQGKTYYFVRGKGYDEVTVKEVCQEDVGDDPCTSYVCEKKDSGIYPTIMKRYYEWDIESLADKGCILTSRKDAFNKLLAEAEKDYEAAKKTLEHAQSNLDYLKRKLAEDVNY